MDACLQETLTRPSGAGGTTRVIGGEEVLSGDGRPGMALTVGVTAEATGSQMVRWLPSGITP